MLDVDGMFGDNTLYAVNEFKEQNKLWNDNQYHGVVGNTTWGVLFSDDAVGKGGRQGSQGNGNNQVGINTGNTQVGMQLVLNEPSTVSDYSVKGHQTESSGYGHASGVSRLTDNDFKDMPFEDDVLPNGNRYKKIIENGRTVIAEYNNSGKIVERWMLAGGVGTTVKGGNGDGIYIKLTEHRYQTRRSGKNYSVVYYDYDIGIGMYKDMAVDMVKAPDSFLNNVENFMYFDASERQFISTDQWRDDIHYKERFALNSDTSLPISPEAAEKQGFRKLPLRKAVYHGSVVGNLKYVHEDGREAIYEPKYKYIEKQQVRRRGQEYKIVSQIQDGYSLMKLEDNPKYGPTYNYVNESESVTGHFLFDMLPYYWWGNTP